MMRRMTVIFLLLISLLLGAVQSSSAAIAQGGKPADTDIYPIRRSISSPQLVEFLKDGSSLNRASAARELGKRKEKTALVPLRALLLDKVIFVQVDAAEALFALGDDSGAQTLRNATLLSSAHPASALIAARILAEHGDFTGESLAQSKLGSKYGTERLEALDVLKFSKNDDVAFAALQTGLNDTLEMVRHRAIFALGNRGTQRAVGMLKPFLISPTTEERAAAAQALGRARMYDGIPLLLGVLNDPEWIVRTGSVHELESLTGQKFPLDASWKSDAATQQTIAQQWNDWWAQNKSKFPPGVKSPIPVTPIPLVDR